MKKSLKLTVLATAIAAVMPFQANAAGLGGINVFSALGQPLRAEIELHATPEELDGMSAFVPSPEAFRRANLEYSALMPELELKVERRGSRSVVRMSSSRVINEPFVDVLVELRWASGSLLREYTFLLDPVDMQPAPAVAAAPARPAASARSQQAATGDARHVVRRGETLHRIALDYLPPNAQLEQMLIALLRENPGAFIGGNINRLRAGVSLDVPDEIAVAAISAEDARREVLAQSAEFEAYRNRVAAAVSARAPTREAEASRESAGRVEPRVEEIVREETPVDQVQVSGTRSVADGSASTPLNVEGAAPAAAIPEEDLYVLRRELDEMRSRLADLEQTVSDQQGIIDIRDSVIARLQSDEVPAGESTQEAAPGVAPVEQPSAAPAPAPAAPPAPPPMQMSEPGLMERITGNPLMLAIGTLVIGLLTLLGLRAARRRREAQEFDSASPHGLDEPAEPLSVVSQPGGESVDTDSNTSVMDTDFSQTGLSAIDADEGVDPVAEADVYLAYGRDAQAEEILLDALKVDASRHAIYLKLLEVYVQRGDRRQFEVIATDLYSRTGGDGADWQKAAAMGRKLDPENPLYSESGEAAGAGTAAVAAAGLAASASAPEAPARALEDTHIGLDQSELDLPDLGTQADQGMPAFVTDQQAEVPEAAEEVESPDLDFDFDALDKVAPASEQPAEAAVQDDGNMMSFDLDLDDAPTPAEAAPEPEALLESAQELVAEELIEEEETVMDLERTEFDANLLDFDLDLTPPPSVKPETTEGMDLTSIDLDLDLPETPEAETVPPAAMAAPEQAAAEVDADESAAVPQFDAQDVQREMETKLELARAYDEMGDREGARELLEEVVKDGSDEQREEAQRMLERLA